MSNPTLKMKNQTPLVTVPSRPSLRLAAVLVIAALMAFCPTLMRADTIGAQLYSGNLYHTAVQIQLWATHLPSVARSLVTQLGLWDQVTMD